MSEEKKVAPEPAEPQQQPQAQERAQQQPQVQEQSQGQPAQTPQGDAHQQPAYVAAAPGTGTVRKDGRFAKFVQNRAVQLAGAGLIGVFIGGGAVATGVAVANEGDDGPDRSGFSRQWQVPDRQQGGFRGGPQRGFGDGDGAPVFPGSPNGSRGGSGSAY
ncbi:hypothetical protein [Actinomadura rudentiformis]|uniref:Uncharacterized protein n=1 Tax=Actinomadura rudentiformis TaxID=359158 RepID=A0A6H9Y987_9ACTN|nr:hypothetical protein [Actinomadura rudentiformis]KAB2339201.1 hypothetical protein F8566_48830 [Actinomadura rudentiformis]